MPKRRSSAKGPKKAASATPKPPVSTPALTDPPPTVAAPSVPDLEAPNQPEKEIPKPKRRKRAAPAAPLLPAVEAPSTPTLEAPSRQVVEAPSLPAPEAPSPAVFVPPGAAKNSGPLLITPSTLLADAMGEVLAETERRVVAAVAPPPPPARAPTAWVAAALASWIVTAALLLLRPAFTRGPVDQPWRPEPAVAEASLRYGLWLARQHIAVFQRDKGRLPSFLAEAGVADPSLILLAEGERSYTVEGRQGDLSLRLSSRMAADSFLGTSLERLRAR